MAMCGRYQITSTTEAIRQLFQFEELPNLKPRYNVAPTQQIPIVRLGEDGRRHLAMVRWGLVPFWAKDIKIGYKMINARAESVAEKRSFRIAFKKRRCLVPTDGFYEWKKQDDGSKQPYRIMMKDGQPFAFAGLWETWNNKESGETIESCTIIVTRANELCAQIHDRMPVILAPNDHEPWLAADADPERLQAVLEPYPAGAMIAYPVSIAVGNVKNDDASLIEPTGNAL